MKREDSMSNETVDDPIWVISINIKNKKKFKESEDERDKLWQHLTKENALFLSANALFLSET